MVRSLLYFWSAIKKCDKIVISRTERENIGHSNHVVCKIAPQSNTFTSTMNISIDWQIRTIYFALYAMDESIVVFHSICNYHNKTILRRTSLKLSRITSHNCATEFFVCSCCRCCWRSDYPHSIKLALNSNRFDSVRSVHHCISRCLV